MDSLHSVYNESNDKIVAVGKVSTSLEQSGWQSKARDYETLQGQAPYLCWNVTLKRNQTTDGSRAPFGEVFESCGSQELDAIARGCSRQSG